jgi:hypothetical protein
MTNNQIKLMLICLISFSLGCNLTKLSNRQVTATAPNIPPQLEKRGFGYLLTWTSDDPVYVSCYPGVVPRLSTTPKAWHSGVRVLTCDNEN